jgi:hypothetical protein
MNRPPAHTRPRTNNPLGQHTARQSDPFEPNKLTLLQTNPREPTTATKSRTTNQQTVGKLRTNGGDKQLQRKPIHRRKTQKQLHNSYDKTTYPNPKHHQNATERDKLCRSSPEAGKHHRTTMNKT